MVTQGLIFTLVIVAVIIKSAIHILKEWERGVVLTLGRLSPRPRGPGLRFILPFIQTLTRVDQRIITMDVPGQDVITRDNVSVKVSAVLYYRVLDPNRAVTRVENYHYATSQLAQTTMRSVCGQAELDELLSNREEMNRKIQEILDGQTEPWGIKVSLVELKHIDLPQEMQRAMARQAEAERERRSKIIQAEGEFQAADKLTQAAAIMSTQSISVHLRYLETLRQIATENHSTVLFPLPMELLNTFKKIGNTEQ
ncbi:MAG: slipin family protein [Deltaproteobacteria bacterium]|nr:slipin family protein [Deltaproteobacteria bacterium]